MSVESPESSRDEDALKLTSLDSESLFTALTAVEKVRLRLMHNCF